VERPITIGATQVRIQRYPNPIKLQALDMKLSRRIFKVAKKVACPEGAYFCLADRGRAPQRSRMKIRGGKAFDSACDIFAA